MSTTITGPEAQPEQRTPQQVDGRLRALREIRWSRAELATLGSLLVVSFLLTAWNLGGGPRYFEDEGTYTARSWSLLDFSLDPYWYIFDHPPGAWMQMAPFVVIFEFLGFGQSAVRTARITSLLALLVIVTLLYVIARRMLINRVVTVVVLAAFVSSPLTQEFMRRVYLDNIATAWALLAFAVAVAPSRHRWNYGLAGMAFGVAVLSKLTMLLLAPALALAVFTFARRDQRWTAPMATAMGAAIIGSLLPLWAAATGQFGNFLAGTLRQVARDGGGSMFVEGTIRHAIVSRWYDYDQGFLYVGLAAAVVVLLASARGRWIGLAVLLPLVQVLRTDGYLPAMYVIFLLPFLTLALAMCAQAVWNVGARWLHFPSRRGRIVTVTAAIALFAMLVGPTVVSRLQADLYTNDINAPVDDGVAWLMDNTTVSERIMADDIVFIDLRRHGRTDEWREVVNVYKLDLDPLATTKLPAGWREFDYILDTPVLRGSLADEALVGAREAYRSSTVMVSFGEGEMRVDVRRVLR